MAESIEQTLSNLIVHQSTQGEESSLLLIHVPFKVIASLSCSSESEKKTH